MVIYADSLNILKQSSSPPAKVLDTVLQHCHLVMMAIPVSQRSNQSWRNAMRKGSCTSIVQCTWHRSLFQFWSVYLKTLVIMWCPWINTHTRVWCPWPPDYLPPQCWYKCYAKEHRPNFSPPPPLCSWVDGPEPWNQSLSICPETPVIGSQHLKSKL